MKEAFIIGAVVVGFPAILPALGIWYLVDQFKSWRKKDYPPPWAPGRGPAERFNAGLVAPFQHSTWKLKQHFRQLVPQHPVFPLEICEIIIGYCSSDLLTLMACSLVCRDLLPISRRQLFSKVIFRLERRTSIQFIKLLQSPFLTISTISRLSIVNEPHWLILEGIVPLLVEKGTKVECLDLRLPHSPKIGQIFPLHVESLRIHTYSYRGGGTYPEAMARFICAFSNLKALKLNVISGCTYHTFEEKELPTLLSASSLTTLSVKGKSIDDPLTRWLLSKCTNLVSIRLFSEASRNAFKYFQVPGKPITDLGLMVGHSKYFHATPSFVLPHLRSVYFTCGSYHSWEPGYHGTRRWYPSCPEGISSNLDALMLNSKRLKKVTVKCGDRSYWLAIENVLRSRGFELEDQAEGNLRQYVGIVSL